MSTSFGLVKAAYVVSLAPFLKAFQILHRRADPDRIVAHPVDVVELANYGSPVPSTVDSCIGVTRGTFGSWRKTIGDESVISQPFSHGTGCCADILVDRSTSPVIRRGSLREGQTSQQRQESRQGSEHIEWSFELVLSRESMRYLRIVRVSLLSAKCR